MFAEAYVSCKVKKKECRMFVDECFVDVRSNDHGIGNY